MEAAIFSAVINPCVNGCIAPIVEPLHRRLGYLFRPGAKVKKLEKASDELNQREDELHEEIARAGAQSDEIVPTKRAKKWMEEVQTIKVEIAKTVEDYQRLKACPTACNCWLRYKIGKRAGKAVQEVEELTRREFPVTERCPPVVRIMADALPHGVTPLSSTGEYLKEAIDYIQRDDVGMVGIWGMGGVGKTTLLHMINNDPSIARAGFDYVILQEVSQDLNLDKLRKDIAERVHAGDARLQAATLSRFLEEKSFLLLLDDIWEPFHLTNGVGIPLPHHSEGTVTTKRKIVFTTRSEAVCSNMDALLKVRCNKIKINCLLPTEAWELFLRNVGYDMRSIIDSDPRVRDLARIVADKCDGLPLALEVLAQAMSGNHTWREWEKAVNQISTIGIQGIDGANPFLPLLKVSYDRLPDDRTKDCFLCCAFWPEDHKIQLDELIDCWRGMNLIDYSGDINSTYTSGYAIVQRLKRACLLEQAEVFYYPSDAVKMHDVIREMALWIVSSERKWIVKNRDKPRHESEDAEQWRNVEIISLSHGWSGGLPQHRDFPNLSSLMLSNSNIKVIPEDFFRNMPVLTFLDMSRNEIEELPPSIGRLCQLRHLNLSHTRIRSLPAELGDLAELKVLLVNNWTPSDISVPRGLLSGFHRLGHLGIIGMWVQDFMEELISSTITSLDCTLAKIGTVERLAMNPSISLRVLEIRGLRTVTTLSLSSLLRVGNTRSTLSRLHIEGCYGLENITISNQREEEVFPNLEYLRLRDLDVLKEITSSAGSPIRNVRFVEIRFCGELRSATWILHCPRIESLVIRDCDEMEHVIGNEEGAEDGIQQAENSMVFSHLTSLQLQCLPKLRSFSTLEIGFPSLKKVDIFYCPLWDKAPFSHLEIR